MAKSKKRSDKSARVFAILLGAFLLLWNCAMLGLYLFGDETEAYNITSARIKHNGTSNPDKNTDLISATIIWSMALNTTGWMRVSQVRGWGRSTTTRCIISRSRRA